MCSCGAAGVHLKAGKNMHHRVRFNYMEARVLGSLLGIGLAALRALECEPSAVSALSGSTSRSSRNASRYGVRSTSAPTVTM